MFASYKLVKMAVLKSLYSAKSVIVNVTAVLKIFVTFI